MVDLLRRQRPSADDRRSIFSDVLFTQGLNRLATALKPASNRQSVAFAVKFDGLLNLKWAKCDPNSRRPLKQAVTADMRLKGRKTRSEFMRRTYTRTA
jgi:hypothetical protein